MTRVDFYIIEEGAETVSDAVSEAVADHATDIFICRLTEKAWSQDNTVYIHTKDEQHAMKFDDLLWNFSEDSFVPHQLSATENLARVVLLGHPLSAEIPSSHHDHHDVLINLNHEIPSFFSQFDRVAEIITPDETSRSKGRKRYQFYRDRGYALETHKMSL
jgi:DNA polymerase-3 subunit chi